MQFIFGSLSIFASNLFRFYFGFILNLFCIHVNFFLIWIVLLLPRQIRPTPSPLLSVTDVIASYKIQFSELDNSGNILNQNFKFYNLHIKHNDKTFLKLRELGLGISLKPHNFFQPVSITTVNIQDGYYNYSDFSTIFNTD